MDFCTVRRVMIVTLSFMWIIRETVGTRFVIDREDCFSHDADYGDTIRVSFVVIKTDTTWHYGDEGVDLTIKGPSGEHIYQFHDKISERYDFEAKRKGLHRFCFINNSPYQETVDFDIHVGHVVHHHDEHVKDEHFKPLLDQLSKLEEALYNIQFEQHWLEAQTDRQEIVNEAMGRRALHKAIFESAALVGASVLQVYLLQRLFHQKLMGSRV